MFVFAYGSLINAATHDLRPVGPARLHGWRRSWRHTKLRKVAYLTVVPDPNSSIDGVILEIPADQRDEVARREAAYDPVEITAHLEPVDRGIGAVMTYVIPDGSHFAPTTENPVLLSYIDVVAQGCLQMFGEDGVNGFFNTTTGWDVPVWDDRAAPLYPRHQALSPAERQMVDEMLAAQAVRLMPVQTS